eukprot:m.486209 g.486209  ORF g.486209 m.486209 type:complete len:445 (+) comp24230_c0_seq1:131-1465(+)
MSAGPGSSKRQRSKGGSSKDDSQNKPRFGQTATKGSSTAITVGMLARSSKHCRRHSSETLDHYLARLTHVSLPDRGIATVTNLHKCPRLSCLYLYDNTIASMASLSNCLNLTQVYLQNNRIGRVEALGKLQGLTKLSLGRNNIGVVEGLHTLMSLRDLRIEHQNLAPGEKLLFDPRSILALSQNLTTLDVTGNGLDDTEDLCGFCNLQTLFLGDNNIKDLVSIAHVFEANPYLAELVVTGNPLTKIPKCFEEIVTMSYDLVKLNGKEITDTSRQFLMNWKAVLDKRAASAAPLGPPKRYPPLQTGRPVRGQPAKEPLFPSKLSAQSNNPHWLPPLPKLRAHSAPKRRSFSGSVVGDLAMSTRPAHASATGQRGMPSRSTSGARRSTDGATPLLAGMAERRFTQPRQQNKPWIRPPSSGGDSDEQPLPSGLAHLSMTSTSRRPRK